MSAYDTFAGYAAAFSRSARGELVTITPKGGDPVAVRAVVLRDPLDSRATDGHRRLEYSIEVQVAKADYPADQPTIGADTIAVAVRAGDTVKTTRVVSVLLGQDGGVWSLGLD